MTQRSASSHFPQRRQWSFSMAVAVREASATPVIASAARIGVTECRPTSPTCVCTSRINRRHAFTPSMSRLAAKTANAITIPGYGFIAAHRETTRNRFTRAACGMSNRLYPIGQKASDNIRARLWIVGIESDFTKTVLRCALSNARKILGADQPPSPFSAKAALTGGAKVSAPPLSKVAGQGPNFKSRVM